MTVPGFTNKDAGRIGQEADRAAAADAVEPVPVSSTAGIPCAAMLPNATYFSCPLCYGTRTALGEPCHSCADPDPSIARFVLERLTPEQMSFLREYGHTLAEQPVAEYPLGVEFFVAADDGVWNDDFDGWIVPNTQHWFAGGRLRFGPCGTASFIHYNPLGLLLRECLMCGADAHVPQYVPASAIEARRAAAGNTDAVHESAVAKPDAPKVQP